MYIYNTNALLCFSASQEIYPALKDVLQKTEPSHKMGLGENKDLKIYLCKYYTRLK